MSGAQYVDSDFQPSTGFKRGVLAHKPHVMDYISGDGSHHALNRKLNRQYFPKSSKFSRRFNILDSGALGPKEMVQAFKAAKARYDPKAPYKKQHKDPITAAMHAAVQG